MNNYPLTNLENTTEGLAVISNARKLVNIDKDLLAVACGICAYSKKVEAKDLAYHLNEYVPFNTTAAVNYCNRFNEGFRFNFNTSGIVNEKLPVIGFLGLSHLLNEKIILLIQDNIQEISTFVNAYTEHLAEVDNRRLD